MSDALERLAAELGTDVRALEAHAPNLDLPPRPADPPPFPEVLRKHPAWTALQAQLVDQTADMLIKLVRAQPQVYKGKDGQVVLQSQEAFLMENEALRGEIRGMLRVLEAPAVALRAIERDRR